MTTHGEFNWNELQTRHADDAIAFYRATIGWQFRAEKMPSGGTYWIGLSSGKPVCGVLTLENSIGSREPDRWVTYVHVDDLDDAIVRMQNSEGEVLRAPWEVPGVGRVAWIRDPGGAEMGWVTPEKQQV
ncbi:MAG: VOC family protein [Gammaproteobacteria bacterium]|nr:VOC family protein [Gammaproteobacteria bacterium]